MMGDNTAQFMSINLVHDHGASDGDTVWSNVAAMQFGLFRYLRHVAFFALRPARVRCLESRRLSS